MDIDMNQISSLVSLAKNGFEATRIAGDAAQKIRALFKAPQESTDTDIKLAMADLCDQIADAKVANADLKIALSNLAEQLVAAERKKADLARYQLYKTDLGDFVYLFEATEDEEEPSHFICPQCYENATKSILQGNAYSRQCPTCKTYFSFQDRPHPKGRRRYA